MEWAGWERNEEKQQRKGGDEAASCRARPNALERQQGLLPRDLS